MVETTRHQRVVEVARPHGDAREARVVEHLPRAGPGCERARDDVSLPVPSARRRRQRGYSTEHSR